MRGELRICQAAQGGGSYLGELVHRIARDCSILDSSSCSFVYLFICSFHIGYKIVQSFSIHTF